MSRKTIISIILAFVGLAALALTRGQGILFGKSQTAPVQNILIQAKGNKFNGVNPLLELRRGVPVEITIRNDESEAIPHDFKVVGLDVKTPKLLQPGESATLPFTPSHSGEFAYTCTLHPGLMDGKLIVRK